VNGLAGDLGAIVGERHVRVARAERATYAMDGLPTRRSLPDTVVLPGTREEVIAVVRLLAAHGVPIVPRGAGTGLSGGALAGEGAVLVVLTRLNRILRVDPPNRLAVVEPGVVNARLSAAVRQHGLHYAPDPSSQTACTIGGNVAENAGGPHCLKYGVTANHILALEVVLANGRTVELGSPGGEPGGGGPDLVGLFVGSEGNFGIATRITVRLTPVPRAVRTLLADFMSLRTAGEGVSAIIAAGIVPAALEMMDRSCIQAVEDSVYAAGYPRDAAAVLLVELDGHDGAAVAAEADAVAALLKQTGARTIRTAADEAERERLWQGRKKAFGAMGRLSRDLVVQDAVVPRSALPDVLETIAGIAARHRLVVSNVFHAGDGNLHPNISFDATDDGQRARVEQASGEIMAACIAAGGTITGEHGVGLDKLRYMPLVFDAESLGAMHAVRRVFDPYQRVNPGKVIPLHACREWSGWTDPGRKPGVGPKPDRDGVSDPRAAARGQVVIP
jgi:glycolate dehydrogenase FAD-linked subunit